MWDLDLENPVVSLLKDESGTNAVEYALIMTLVGALVVAGALAMSIELADLFNAMASCTGDVVNCTPSLF